MFKTNDTKDRVSYSSMLLPPAGYSLQFAVGTTYSLDLAALTAVCLALGLAEDMDSKLLQDPVSLLNALQKVSEKLLIFCEAGQIKMPSKSSPLELLLEKMIIPVALPKTKAAGFYPAFHPKMWLLQYVNAKGEHKYRLAVLSRNLTFDRSWDISFAMDSDPSAPTVQKTQPLLHFLDFLCGKISPAVQNAAAKQNALRKLRGALSNVAFSTNTKEFGDDFEIMPLGIGAAGYNMLADPLFSQKSGAADYSFNELAVFSPFISGSMIEYWNKPEHSLLGTTRTLITRKSELTKFAAAQSDNFQIYTLKDDIVDGEDAISDADGAKQKQDIHAKLYLRRKYTDVDIYLGSMNATHAAVHSNVEMLLRLRTKSRYYNGEKFLSDLFCGKADGTQNPFEPAAPAEAAPDPQQEAAIRLEQLVKAVCRLPMRADVTEQDGKYDISLTVDGQIPDGDISITPFRRDNPLPLAQKMFFRQLDILQVSEFYLLRVKGDGLEIERMIMIPTRGIPAERENAVVNSVIKDRRTFVEYVAFILGDEYLLSLLEGRSAAANGAWQKGHASLPALYEKMLRAALQEPEKITEIGYLVRMITKEDVVPQEFRELYATFKKTLKLKDQQEAGHGKI